MSSRRLEPTVVRHIQPRNGASRSRVNFSFTSYYGQLPTELYTSIKELPGTKETLMQCKRNKELVVARTSLSVQFADILQATHEGIASIICVFDNLDHKILIQEYMDLNVFQLGPLSETELASTISQVWQSDIKIFN